MEKSKKKERVDAREQRGREKGEVTSVLSQNQSPSCVLRLPGTYGSEYTMIHYTLFLRHSGASFTYRLR